MRIIKFSAVILFLAFGFQLSAQDYVELELGQTKAMQSVQVNFNGVIKKTKHNEDYYRVTVTVTNEGRSWFTIFDRAVKSYVKSDKSVVAQMNFLNATGRGLSATRGKIYGRPIMVQVPYKCKKCPPPKSKKEDPYNHYLRPYVVGSQFQNGSSLVHSFSIRVPEGQKPKVRVMLQ
jgi:hypothetical protein